MDLTEVTAMETVWPLLLLLLFVLVEADCQRSLPVVSEGGDGGVWIDGSLRGDGGGGALSTAAAAVVCVGGGSLIKLTPAETVCALLLLLSVSVEAD